MEESTRDEHGNEFLIRPIPGWFLGLFERSLFTFLVALKMPAVFHGILAWIALKVAFTWKKAYRGPRPDPDGPEPTKLQEWTHTERLLMFQRSSILATIVSLVFACLGGLVCRGDF